METRLIEQLRKNRDIPKKELCEAMNVTYSGYREIMQRNDLRVSVLEKVANFFHIDVCWFFRQSDDENASKLLANEPETRYRTSSEVVPAEVYEKLLNQIDKKDQQINTLNKIIEKTL